jgi:hypothetical protein
MARARRAAGAYLDAGDLEALAYVEAHGEGADQ